MANMAADRIMAVADVCVILMGRIESASVR